MTPEQIHHVALRYQLRLSELGHLAKRADTSQADLNTKDALPHIMWMLREIRFLVVENRIEKAMRWLGFAQGVLWAHGIYSIEEMKEDNRSDGS